MEVKVPFNNLFEQYLSLRNELDEAINSVIKQSAFVRGPFVEEFEKQFSKMFNIEHCISCANGTDALYISMKAMGLKKGDEVLVPAHTWISSSETITQAGGKVVFCDTNKDTFTIDPDDIEKKITSSTVGIIPVHLFGQPADMDAIMEIAKRRGLWVLEDCAQAHLAEFNGKKVGTFGNAASFSFYPGKNLGAMGDAGAILTNDSSLSEKMQRYARHGGLFKGEHLIEGINSRLDGLQAAILSVKLNKLPEWTTRRQQVAQRYSQNLDDVDCISLPVLRHDRSHVFHLYVIRCGARDDLKAFLYDNGVETVINYPVALPFIDAYRYLKHSPEQFKNAYSNQHEILSLPIYPEISNDQVDYVCNLIKQFSVNQNKID